MSVGVFTVSSTTLHWAGQQLANSNYIFFYLLADSTKRWNFGIYNEQIGPQHTKINQSQKSVDRAGTAGTEAGAAAGAGASADSTTISNKHRVSTMARHIMAVCVVCLLCAQRLHCQDHDADKLWATQRTTISLNAHLANGNLSPSSEISTEQRQLADENDTQNYSTSPPFKRHKRHAGRDHEHEHEHGAPLKHVPQITQHYLQQLMQLQEALNASSLRTLMQQLGLQHLVSSNDSVSSCNSCQLQVWLTPSF